MDVVENFLQTWKARSQTLLGSTSEELFPGAASTMISLNPTILEELPLGKSLNVSRNSSRKFISL